MSRVEKNWDEATDIVARFHNDKFMLTQAIVQLIQREKVRTLNKYLSKRGEPLIPTDPPLLPGGGKFEWIIDVPKEWYSLTGKQV